MTLNNAYPMPSLHPDQRLSFYPYPISSRQNLHSSLLMSIRGVAGSTSSTPHTGLGASTDSTSVYTSTWSSTASPQAGPGPTSLSLQAEKRARRRAERRAIAGRRPAGVGIGRDADELSEEEDALAEDRMRVDMFGHRFLLPIGRRQTQMEMDQAPSPSPSEADQDRRQEDRGLASPTAFMHVPVEGDEDGDGDDGDGDGIGPGGQLDLDASIEDMDGDVEDLDASMEDRDGEGLEDDD